MRSPYRQILVAGLALVAALAVRSAVAADGETWKDLKGAIFGERPIIEESSIVALKAPARAEDAAIVPVEIRAALPQGHGRTIVKITLIVDENPMPVAAAFRFGPERRDIALSTRLRVDSYSFVRAVAELSDGALHMVARYVKASGGCSAPALKDADQALARIGEMRLKPLAPIAAMAPNARPLAHAQVMIRHPNYSGLQMDQLTRLYIPAKFVSNILVKEGEEVVFAMEGGISLSEDPVIGFSYAGTGQPLSVSAHDTDGRSFSQIVPAHALAGRS